MNPARDELRRGWCPTSLKPMRTGDGWLVRIYPPARGLSPAELAGVAAMARAHGSGAVEISARASIQIRGVTPQTHPALVTDLEAAGLLDEPERGPARLALVSPLAGRDRSDHLDARALAGAVEALGRGIPGLPEKACVVVDGGGAFALDGFAGDVRLRALASDAVMIGLPGGLWFGPQLIGDALVATGSLLRLLATRHAADPAVRRLADMDADDVMDAMAQSGRSLAAPPPARRPPPRAGLLGTGGNACALVALPFGRTDAGGLDALARLAREAGAIAITASPTRGLALHGLAETAARTFLTEATALGFITDPDDPRLAVVACTGRPGCERGQADTLAAAAAIAAALPGGVGKTAVHVSGCVKACAHPGPAPLTLVAEAGRFRLARDGTTRDAGDEALDLDTVLGRLRGGGDLAAALRHRS